uniref:Uncharacterized protein n=1 Tax=mine drainage metagenome TaxID=410659 RepID=E6PXI3_9ZZZZ
MLICRIYSSLRSSPRLPDDAYQCGQKCPSGDSIRPCYECVPPVRVVFAALGIFIACALFFWGDGKRYTIFCACSLVFFAGSMLPAGHKYHCADGNNYPYDPSTLPHMQNCTPKTP